MPVTCPNSINGSITKHAVLRGLVMFTDFWTLCFGRTGPRIASTSFGFPFVFSRLRFLDGMLVPLPTPLSYPSSAAKIPSILLEQWLVNFFVKNQGVNICGFVGNTVPVAATALHPWSVKACLCSR